MAPYREHLHKNEIRISAGDAIGSVLTTVFERADETFYDDVLLVDAEGQLIGPISNAAGDEWGVAGLRTLNSTYFSTA